MAGDDTKTTFFCLIYTIVLIVSLTLFGVSWDTLEPTQIGLVYDKNIQKIEGNKAYLSGRHLIGLGRTFIKFPSTQQSLRFGHMKTLYNDNPDGRTIDCRTKDGLQIHLEVAVQYVLSQEPADLFRLYLDVGKNWKDIYTFFIQQVVRDVASLYNALEFREARDGIADHIHKDLDKIFLVMYASVPTFQLLNIEIDNQFAAAITSTQVAKQDVYQAAYEREVIRVEASTDYEVAIKLREIKIESAKLKAQEIQAVAQANINIIENTITSQIQAFKSLKQNLNFTRNSELLSYLWMQAMQTSKANDLVLSMDFPSNMLM